jgi:alpha-1,6-mannosyltransferase
MKWLHAISIFVLIAATCFLGYVPGQSDFYKIASSGFLAFLAYGYLSFYNVPSLKTVFVLGMLIRVILLFAFPNLSDDIYRFVWDGNLIGLNINPYGSMPSELVAQSNLGLSKDLYAQMNSPYYYTIYPPATQLIFYISTWFGGNLFYSSLIIKLFFLAAEVLTFIGIVKILDALQKEKTLAIIYFLNPLILVEGMVNLHFEIIMIVFLIWSIYFLFIKKNIVWSSLLLTLSIASKLLPLMFLPFFFFGMKGKERIKFFSLGLVFMAIAFSPIILGLDFQNFASSIDLYFQNFEFNGGVYYLFRYLGTLASGYNLIHYIGPSLGLLSLVLILKKAYDQKNYSLEIFLEFAFYSFVVYLFLATTIHPWYMCIPIVFSVFVKWRFALVWSFLVLLTYINYSYNPYWENLWIVSIEYLIVFSVLIYELKFIPSIESKVDV